MLDEGAQYSPRFLGNMEASKLNTIWDNDLIMDWIETQPNPFKEPEFYELMVEHDPLQIILSREIREQLGEVWSLDHEFVHPLAVEIFEHQDDENDEVTEAAEAQKFITEEEKREEA
ncbi:hypothetical protein VM1G_09889 [Cytospora mali]|uniref:Uncharacterized protein n=1 Tax=Cytospora mali TaxID=578113 RepID=A0A194WCR1_CYTMA|nr:hypothetical protein VM1G_09889 [Valsa mali]